MDGYTDERTLYVPTDGWTFPPLMLLGRLRGVDLKMSTTKKRRCIRQLLQEDIWACLTLNKLLFV